ncbi:MAG: hypothetical protein AAF602_11205 [Myxococcota bacterium]
MSRNWLALSLCVLAAAIVYAATPPASAQPAPTAVCEAVPPTAKGMKNSGAWMSEQMAAGRTNFTAGGSFICAW